MENKQAEKRIWSGEINKWKKVMKKINFKKEIKTNLKKDRKKERIEQNYKWRNKENMK